MKFDKAPIAEVVLGLQFKEPVFTYKFIYNFYNSIKDNFPEIQENQILPTVIEKIDEPTENKILQGFNSRKFFIHKNQNKLIQMQPDRLLFNWRKLENAAEYPHFINVKDEFLKIFASVNEIQNIKSMINQLEMTYVDNIFIDQHKADNFDTKTIFNIFNLRKDIKTLDYKISYPIVELNGNVHLSIKNAKSKKDQRKLLVVESTTRGALLNGMSIDEWFEASHKELLDLFNNITTDSAKEIWGINK